MRYLWDQYHINRNGAGRLSQIAMSIFASQLRIWDVTSAARVDLFVANSTHVSKRIRKYFRRDSTVVYPPVAVGDFTPLPRGRHEEFYLWVGELSPYERPDLAVEAFTKLGLPLIVIDGPEKVVHPLARKAGENVKFLGKADFLTVKDHIARCKALVFTGEEDFGMVPVNVMASGRPVIAYGRGGDMDTIIHGETGYLFEQQLIDGLVDAVKEFEGSGLTDVDPKKLVNHARRFGEAAFQEQ